MKKLGIFFITAFLLMGLACGCRERAELLSCTVTEVYENAVMAICVEEGGGLAEGQKVYVSCETMPQLAPGDVIRVTFSGQAMHSEPMQVVAEKVEKE